MTLDFNCVATGIGSLPLTDPEKAAALSLALSLSAMVRIGAAVAGVWLGGHLLTKTPLRVLVHPRGTFGLWGAGLVVTTSRRTGAENEAILRAALADVPSLIWDGQGDNPYFGMLALADAVVVTCDSVSMISEACYTGSPVHVYDFPGGSKRFRRFREDLERGGLTRPFRGRLESWQYTPLDETRRAADFVRSRYALRGQS